MEHSNIMGTLSTMIRSWVNGQAKSWGDYISPRFIEKKYSITLGDLLTMPIDTTPKVAAIIAGALPSLATFYASGHFVARYDICANPDPLLQLERLGAVTGWILTSAPTLAISAGLSYLAYESCKKMNL